MFKLFDKDPSHLPGTLRTQVWSLWFILARFAILMHLS